MINTKIFETLAKKYEMALINRNREIRLTVEEAGLLIANINILLNNNITVTKDNSEKNIVIKMDSGFFSKK